MKINPPAHSINRREFLQLTGCGMSGLFLSAMGFTKAANLLSENKHGPASSDRPNILLMVMDTVRSESLSVNGYQKPTSPQIERLAKGGVLFRKAISTSPWTLPAHASMFTGHYPFELSTGFSRSLDRTYPTLAEALQQNGYETAGFVANKIYCDWEFGLNRGFSHYEDFRTTPDTLVMNSALVGGIIKELNLEQKHQTHNNFGHKSAEQVRVDLFKWLELRDSSRPFFAFLNFFDAHLPYVAPEKYTSKFTNKKPMSVYPPHLNKTMDPIALNELNIAYDAGIAYIDDQLGLIVDNLDAKGLLDNTIVVIVSDHGEQFGEHGQLAHGNNLYMTLIHVPLLILFPGRIPQGRVVDTPVSLVDVPATLIDIASLESKFPGKSLANHWNGNPLPQLIRAQVILDNVDVAAQSPMGNWESLILDSLHYVRQPDGKEELFNISKDPLELVDLSKSQNNQLDFFRTKLTPR